MEAESFLGKAKESLASAEGDYAEARYNSCERGLYYAAFQAAIAALSAEGIRPKRRWEHEFVRAEFSGRLIHRRKLYDASLRALLTDAFDRRADADYTEKMLKRGDVARLLIQVRQMVLQAEERVRGHR